MTTDSKTPMCSCAEFYQSHHPECPVLRHIEALEQRLAAAELNAARYEWLKANHLQTGPDSWIRTGDDLEEAIDAARGKP